MLTLGTMKHDRKTAISMAKNTATWCVLGMALTMVSCSNDGAKVAPTGDTPPAQKLSPSGRESMDRQADQTRQFQELNAVQVENKVSPYRYVISTEMYSVFGELVKASSHSRTIHSAGVTLLCPTDKAFESFDNWKMMLRQGNQDVLDEFVAHHVVPKVMSYEAFKLQEEHPTLAGENLGVSTRGGVFFNDAHVRSGHVETLNGNVIGLDDVAFVPFSMR